MSTAPKSLRPLSARPELLADDHGRLLQSPGAVTQLGMAGPLGRGRVVSALPLRDGPVQIVKPTVFAAADGTLLADPQQRLLGSPGLKIDRLLQADRTLDTRRL